MTEVGSSLTSSDPQPPEGTVVRDADGTEWILDGEDPRPWFQVDEDNPAQLANADPESWIKVAGNYGPVTVVRTP